MKLFKEIYQYRELLYTSIKKDIRGKYKGSVLGILWSFLNPLLQVFVYYLVFPYLMGNVIDNYLIYLITGLIPWTFFLTTVQQGTRAIKDNAGIVKKVYFPREILLISQVCSGLINFFISCIIILIFCLGAGVGISIHVLAVPVIAVVQALLTLGIILILSAVEVYIQDLEYIVQFVLQMGFYAAPVIYPLKMFSKAGILLTIIKCNPLTLLLNGYRNCFLYHAWPNWFALAAVLLLALIVCAVGFWVFGSLQKNFAEEL
ncbi:MAG: ABC transporter permease [Erysipelotrichaceae bacterium]|nr:ABC transporter permease [Erysipelotrichaceae bacterium]